MSVTFIDHAVGYIICTIIISDDLGPVVKAYAMTQLVKRIAAAAVIDRFGVYITEVFGLVYIYTLIVCLT